MTRRRGPEHRGVRALEKRFGFPWRTTYAQVNGAIGAAVLAGGLG